VRHERVPTVVKRITPSAIGYKKYLEYEYGLRTASWDPGSVYFASGV
jgi:hypothetical protein